MHVCVCFRVTNLISNLLAKQLFLLQRGEKKSLLRICEIIK